MFQCLDLPRPLRPPLSPEKLRPLPLAPAPPPLEPATEEYDPQHFAWQGVKELSAKRRWQITALKVAG